MGIVTPMKEGAILEKNINVLIWELDAKEQEQIAMKEAVKEHWN